MCVRGIKTMIMALKMKNSNLQLNEQILRLMQADDSVDAPQDQLKWAKNLFAARAGQTRGSLVKKVMAVLQIDLSPGKAAFGERSAGAGQARQMLFDAGENSVDLRVKNVKGKFDIHGQILGDNFPGGKVRIGSLTADISDTGEFQFKGVAAGTYTLTVAGKDTEITIEGLELK